MIHVDWRTLFVPQVSILELMLRGTLMYLGIFAALRVFRRASGSIGTADLLLLVLIADAAQNAMASHYGSVTEGAVLVGTIIGWNYVLDLLEYRYAWARRLIQPRPLPLIVNGHVRRANLRAEMMTVQELKQLLREHEVEDIANVRRAYLEPDGKLSVLKGRAKGGQGAHDDDRTPF